MWSIRLLGLAALGLSASTAVADPAVPDCPDTYKELTDAQKAGEFTCKCTMKGGQVFGSGTFTADSSICDAAILMGIVTGQDHTGNVTVKGAPGCPTYASNWANDVSSKAWGKYEASFYFPAKSDGKCVEVELPKPEMKNAALEKAIADAYKRDYGDKVLKVILFGWDEDLEKDDFGQVTGRDMSAVVVTKLENGTCSLHEELWMQSGNGRSFSGPFHARGAGSAQDTPINCAKVETPAKAPAKAPAKKKK
jgi:hypothetical protein